jgi:imidazoleglycerol-phosphate dehydratase
MTLTISPTEKIVEEVNQIQRNQKYTDQQMADFLCCSRITYFQTRTGKRKVGSAFFNGAIKFLASIGTGDKRSAVIRRETGETNISMELSIDGSGRYEITTGIGMFDHLLSQLARHGLFDIKLTATGDDPHHLVEDVAICLGQALGKALGEKRGIVRMADVDVPMDEALVAVAVDISGRGYAVLDLPFADNDMFGFPSDLVRHFLESFANEARMNLHAKIVYGSNDHHKAEALFKALGRALDTATRIDERISGELPTTKGFLEG